MAKKPRERTQRRHVREKATIDHLVQEVFEPKTPDGETHRAQPHHIDRLAGRRSGPQGMGSSQGRPSDFFGNKRQITIVGE